MAKAKRKAKPQAMQAAQNVPKLLKRAVNAHQNGDLSTAQKLYQRIISEQPRHAEALHMLGVIAYQLNNDADCIVLISKALSIQPNYAQAYNNLGNAYKRQARYAEAAQAYEQAIALQPNFFQAYNNLGSTLVKQERYTQALTHYQKALQINPNHVSARNNLANVLKEQKKYPDAIEQYREVLRQQPEHAKAHCNIAILLQEIGEIEQAEQHHQQSLALAGDSAEAHYNLGNLYFDRGRNHEALLHYEKAIDLGGDFVALYNNMGILYRSKGEVDKAILYFEKIHAKQPDNSEVCKILDRLRTREGTDDQDLSLEHLLAQLKVEKSNSTKAMNLHFAVAELYDKQQQYDDAFLHYRQANTIKRSMLNYNLELDKRAFAEIQSIFTADIFAARRAYGSQDKTPIFIVGMPRSGTSLTEQILASHSQVAGVGESLALSDAINVCPELPGGSLAYFKQALDLSASAAQQLGDDYIRRVRELVQQPAQYVVNKRLFNFIHLGLIKLILPNAKIIHCVRNPLDTCLSCYKHLFNSELNFTYDLDELGEFYQIYQNLMQHWHAVFPGEIYDLSYEALVSDFNATVHDVLAFVDLQWEDACAHFYETERFAHTANAEQVRQPLYQKSVGAWQRYAHQLQVLSKVLQP